MPFGVGFILLLMLVGGVAAYWGDHVGKHVGRKRLTIMGLRPKHTSRVVAISTGVLIVLFTLATLLIISNSVRQALFGMEELQGRVADLSAEVHAFEDKRIALEARNQELLERSQQLELETDQLEREKAGLSDEVTSLESQVVDVGNQLSRARIQLDSLEESLEFARFLGEQFWNVAQTLYEAEFVVHVGDVLGTFLVDVTGGEAQAIADLEAGLAAAEHLLVERDFRRPSSGRLLRLDRSYSVGEEVISFSAEEVLDQAVQTLMEWSEDGLESAIVQLAAVTNARVDDAVFVDFRFVNNEAVFREGALIGSHVFDPTRPGGALMEDVMAFLQRDISGVARTHLLPLDGEYGQVTFGEAYALVENIAQHDEPVTVHVRAAKDIWAHESLSVRFSVVTEANSGGVDD